MPKYVRKTTEPTEYHWNRGRIVWIFINAYWMKNKDIAADCGMALTTMRNKMYEMGLQEEEKFTWSDEQRQFYLDHFRQKGDVEIAQMMQVRFPRFDGKVWTKKHMRKQLTILGLFRTKEELAAIFKNNYKIDGRASTIQQNSSSLNMHPSWVVHVLARKESDELKEQLKKDPEFIKGARILIKTRKQLKNAQRQLERRTDKNIKEKLPDNKKSE